MNIQKNILKTKINIDSWKGKKFRLKKVLLCGVTTLSFLTGCSNENSYHENSYSNTVTSRELLNNIYEIIISALPVLNNTNYNDFIEYLDALQISYPYENIYGVDEAYESYLNHKDSISKKYDHANLTTDVSELTAQELVKIIKNNNTKSQNIIMTQLEDGAILKQFTDEELLHISEVILNTVKTEATKYPNWDKDTVACNLLHLSVFDFNCENISDQYKTIDNTQVIFINRQDITKQNDLDYVISHETLHMLQDQCIEKKNESHYEYLSYFDSELTVNPILWKLFSESRADLESESIYAKESPFGYIMATGVYNLMKFSSSIQDGEKMLNQCETLEELFQLFQCETDLEKKEFIKAIFSLELSMFYASHDDFIQAYENETGIKIQTIEDEMEFANSVQTSGYQFLTKFFYRNLAKLSVNGKISLEDNLYLISIYEKLLVQNLFNFDESYNEYKKIYDFYSEIKTYYLNTLSNSINNEKSLRQIKNYVSSEMNHFSFTDNKNMDINFYPTLKFFDKDKIDFMMSLHNLNSNTVSFNSLDAIFSREEEKHNELSEQKVKTYE